MVDPVKIKPQEGFQMDFLSSPADIAFGGGAAGAGKTWAELIEAVRHTSNKNFGATIFRRSTPQIRNKGALLDASKQLYYGLGARLRDQALQWIFPSGADVRFAHLEYDKTVHDYQGSEIPLIIFDEVTHFTEYQFFYMLSRNRSTCGVSPYVRATCNPDPDSWVAGMVEWYIDEEGYPIPERSGKLRYFVRKSGNIVWGDSKAEVLDKIPTIVESMSNSGIDPENLIKSFTFIPGDIYGNKELLKVNPEYLGGLMAQDEANQARLLHGNWKVRISGLQIAKHKSVDSIFSNFPSSDQRPTITCDVARFGRDLAVVMSWNGTRVVRTDIFTKSSMEILYECIENRRYDYNVPIHKVAVDQDGVGGGLVDRGDYEGVSGGAAVKHDPNTGIKENYFNYKTQLNYRFCEDKINNDMLSVEDNFYVDGERSEVVTIEAKTHNIKDLIKKQLRSIRRRDPDKDGKKRMIPKDEQKAILNGVSPDFADCLVLNEHFTLNENEQIVSPIH